MAGYHTGEQREVVLHDLGRDRHGGHIDHAQPGVPQEQQENEEPLLVRLLQGAASLANTVHADRGNDDDGLAFLVPPHDLPDAAHLLLESVEALVAFLVAELCQRCPSRGSGSHGVPLAESSPVTSKAETALWKPRKDSSPTDRLTARSSAAAFTRWVMRICQGAASAHRRAARLVTLPIEAYSKRPAKPIRPSVA